MTEMTNIVPCLWHKKKNHRLQMNKFNGKAENTDTSTTDSVCRIYLIKDSKRNAMLES